MSVTPPDQRRIPPAEMTEYPWWVIIDPDVIHGLFDKQQRVGRVAAAITGPFMSREAANEQLNRRRHAYGPNTVVYSLSGHDSADWRTLCHEQPAEHDALQARLTAAEAALAAAQAELKQAQDDGRLMLAHIGTGIWRRMEAAGGTWYERDLDHWLRNSLDDAGEGPALAELYAARRLLALGDFFGNPCGPLAPVPALIEPELVDDDDDDEVDDDE